MNTLETAVTYVEDFYARYHSGNVDIRYTVAQRQALLDELKEYILWSIEGEIAITEQQQEDIQEYIHWTPIQVDTFFIDVIGQEAYTKLLNEATTDLVTQVIDRDSTMPVTQ